jgi:hypothetical protein
MTAMQAIMCLKKRWSIALFVIGPSLAKTGSVHALPISLPASNEAFETHGFPCANSRHIGKSSSFRDELAARVAGETENDSNDTQPQAKATARPGNATSNEPSLKTVFIAHSPKPIEVTRTIAEQSATIAKNPETLTRLVREHAGIIPGRTELTAPISLLKQPTKPASDSDTHSAMQETAPPADTFCQAVESATQIADQISSSAAPARATGKAGLKESSNAIDAFGDAGAMSPQETPRPAVTGDLALAVKVSGSSTDATEGQGQPALPAVASAVPVNPHPQMHEGEAHARSITETIAPPAVAETIAGEVSRAAHAEQANASVPAHSAAATLEQASELEKLRSESVRGVHVQIENQDNAKVDVRMFERAGQLSVTMRSTTPELTHALQDHSSELTTHLSLEHYRTELWTPSNSNTSDAKSSGGQHTAGEGNRSSSGNNSNQREKKKDQAPKWIDELEQTPLARKVTTTL